MIFFQAIFVVVFCNLSRRGLLSISFENMIYIVYIPNGYSYFESFPKRKTCNLSLPLAEELITSIITDRFITVSKPFSWKIASPQIMLASGYYV